MEQVRQGLTEKGKEPMEKGGSIMQERQGLMEQGGSGLQGERQGARQDASGSHRRSMTQCIKAPSKTEVTLEWNSKMKACNLPPCGNLKRVY